MDVADLLSRPLSMGQELAARRAIRQFAHKFGFAYLGSVDHSVDEHELIRGVTAAATHTDGHFCVGEFKGHDVSLVERRNTLTHPERASEHYRWLIMQVDLRREELPLVFIDGHHHQQAFYEALFMRFGNLLCANSALLAQHDPLAARSFRVYTPADRLEDAEQVLTPEVTAMLAHHFRQFDYEIGGDRLLVYASNPVVSLRLLHEMLRVGTWLAEQLEGLEKKPENR